MHLEFSPPFAPMHQVEQRQPSEPRPNKLLRCIPSRAYQTLTLCRSQIEPTIPPCSSEEPEADRSCCPPTATSNLASMFFRSAQKMPSASQSSAQSKACS